MSNQEVTEELKHLIRYYHQASHEFFDDVSKELKERLENFHAAVEKKKATKAECTQFLEQIDSYEQSLKKKLADISYLTAQMKLKIKELN